MTKMPIGFRAWDKRHEHMIDIDDLYWFEENGIHSFDDGSVVSGDYEFMQFTGLLDKNGTKIFEGDKIRTAPLTICEVVFRNGAFVGKDIVGTYIDDDHRYKQLAPGTGEVIGNIYKNPERLISK